MDIFIVTKLFHYIHNYKYAALAVSGMHILNGDLTLVGTGHYSAAGIDYEYVRDSSTTVEAVSSIGPLVNAITVQVCFSLIM